MQADRDDAPLHLRHRPRQAWVLPVILVSGILWTALFIFAEPISIEVEHWRHARVDNPIQQRLAPSRVAVSGEQAIRQSLPAPQPPPGMHTYRTPMPALEPPQRQTEFNDSNYRPRTGINTIPGIQLGMVSEPRRQKASIRRGPEHWVWQNSGSRESGYFYWKEHDGRIDWNSVCDTEKYGSFRYRDCRKAAKVTFAKLCSRYQPACMAENHYRPL